MDLALYAHDRNAPAATMENGMIDRMAKDIEAAHRRRWPGRPMTLVSRSRLLMSAPSLRAIFAHRIAHWIYRKQESGQRRGVWKAMKLLLAVPKWAALVSSKIEISNQCELGAGVCFSDQGFIVFGPAAAGEGTVIGPRVTFGKNAILGGNAEVGKNVWIGADCVVYGPIRIGDGATVLPGTVLNRSIPAGAVVQGNPARLIMANFDNAELRARPDMDAVEYIQRRRSAHV